MDTPSTAPDGGWIVALERHVLRRLLGARTHDLALASELRYIEAPSLQGEAVCAVVGEGAAQTFTVELRMPSAGTLLGRCSRCSSPFGPCVHVGVLAVDLAGFAPLRDALLGGEEAARAAEAAPTERRRAHLERAFDGALSAWLAPASEGASVEIAAAPSTESEAPLGRAYGDRATSSAGASLSLFVRRRGERRLLSPRELGELDAFSTRDRRVLEHARDRASPRKAAVAVGVDASLAIEAMRVHGGVFSAGFRGQLDFRATFVRPTIRLEQRGDGSSASPRPGRGAATARPPRAATAPSVDEASNEPIEDGETSPAARAPAEPPPGFDVLAAYWVGDDGVTSVPFESAWFFAGPFPYVWTKRGAIFRIARDVDLDVVAQLAAAPALHVPRQKLRDAGTRLLRATRGRGIAVPAPEVFGLSPVETPRLVLRLEGEPLELRGELVAVYRGREIVLLGASAGAASASEDGRDLDTEARARDRVIKAGIVHEDAGDERDGESTPVLRVGASNERAVEFWQRGLPELRDRERASPAIDVRLSPRLARVRVGAPLTGRVHVVLEGGWLRTRLEFASDELPVELDRVRAALERKHRWVALDDGTLSRISASIEALTDEAAEVMGKEADALLPPHQLGRLERWIEDNDGRVDAAVQALRRKLRALAVSAEPIPPEGLVATLRPYQRLGLAWLQFLEALGAGGILADDMGLGKTVTTLAFLLRQKEALGPAPSLVVCPTSVVTNWAREAARFTPDLRVLVLHGPSRDPRAIAEADVVVTTYGLLRRDVDALARVRFRCAVLDEAQNIKNPESATTRAAARLDTQTRLALSGTPMENCLRELWSLASFANPGILGTMREFETRFERPIASDRASPLAAELRAVVRPFLLRRTKEDVLKELPPKTDIDRFVALGPEGKRTYDALAHTLRASLKKDIARRGLRAATLSVFTALTRLRQMACDPRLIDPELLPSSSAKRDAFLEVVRELVAEGRRALVFSQFVGLLTLWRRDLEAENIPYEYLDGSTTKRDAVVTRFQEGSAPLFLISLKAGGAGLNLTAADTVIHCDPWWNPAVEDQATDRAYRIGQDKPVTVIRLVARGTIEDKILSLKATKRELTRVVIDGDAGALEGITEDDLRLLLGDTGDEDDDDGPGPRAENGSEHVFGRDDVRAPTDTLATMTEVLDPEFYAMAAEVRRWLATTSRLHDELARVVDIPAEFAARVAEGAPFPCSRAVAARIRARLRAW